jgi:hypothetical protein
VRANVTTFDTIRGSYLATMGQAPFTWGPPDGFPQDAGYWSALPLPRWNFAFNLAAGTLNGVAVDLTAVRGGAITAAQIADRLDALLFANAMPQPDKAALVTYLTPDPPPVTRVRDALGLALASPGFQWH